MILISPAPYRVVPILAAIIISAGLAGCYRPEEGEPTSPRMHLIVIEAPGDLMPLSPHQKINITILEDGAVSTGRRLENNQEANRTAILFRNDSVAIGISPQTSPFRWRLGSPSYTFRMFYSEELVRLTFSPDDRDVATNCVFIEGPDGKNLGSSFGEIVIGGKGERDIHVERKPGAEGECPNLHLWISSDPLAPVASD